MQVLARHLVRRVSRSQVISRYAYSTQRVRDIGQPTPASHPHLMAEGELTPGIRIEEYIGRRKKLADLLPQNSLAIISSAPVKMMTDVVPYNFRQEADYLYLTGCQQPGGVAVLSDEHGLCMFMPETTPNDITWQGEVAGVDAASEVFMAEQAYPMSKLPERRREEMDRVSDLPDEILCHILSFLTTKEAALTSILAKRWRNLLAFLPCLTIDDSLLLHPQYGSQETKRSFTDFVDTVLGNNNSSPPLNKLSLNFDTFAYADRLDGWISNALARGVSDLSLKIDRGIDVSLVAGGLLKTLALDSVWVCPKEFETLLLHALPSLDELVLVNVWWKDRDVNVSSASLKTLTIVSRYWLNFTTLSFDTPSLLRFKYSGCNEPDFRVVDMGNLVDAHIFLDLCRRSCNVENPQVEHHQVAAAAAAIDYTNVRKLFHGVRNVLNLVLFPATFEVLFACSQSMPAFENLKSFAIKSDKGCGWQAMPALLRNCPRLETLVIEGLMQDVTSMWMCGGVCNCISREGKGLSLGFCRVRLLKIHRFQGTVKEMEIIKHFLDSLPCLEEMRVYVEEKNSLTTELENREVSKRVLEMFQLYKKSSSCNVKLMVGDVLCI